MNKVINFYEALEKRRSVRAFEDRPVEAEKIKKLSEVINLAPSAGNLQGLEVVLVTDKNTLKQLSDAALGQKFVAEAQAAFVFFANPPRSAVGYGERGRRLYAMQDATIAALYVHLTAAAEGLGSCWVGAFDDAAVSSVMNAPKEYIPAAIIPIGYPGKNPKPRPRRDLSDIIKKERF